MEDSEDYKKKLRRLNSACGFCVMSDGACDLQEPLGAGVLCRKLPTGYTSPRGMLCKNFVPDSGVKESLVKKILGLNKPVEVGLVVASAHSS